jgi:hypothetical protein
VVVDDIPCVRHAACMVHGAAWHVGLSGIIVCLVHTRTGFGCVCVACWWCVVCMPSKNILFVCVVCCVFVLSNEAVNPIYQPTTKHQPPASSIQHRSYTSLRFAIGTWNRRRRHMATNVFLAKTTTNCVDGLDVESVRSQVGRPLATWDIV